MNTNTIDSESTGKLEVEVAKANGKRMSVKKAKSAKKAAQGQPRCSKHSLFLTGLDIC